MNPDHHAILVPERAMDIPDSAMMPHKDKVGIASIRGGRAYQEDAAIAAHDKDGTNVLIGVADGTTTKRTTLEHGRTHGGIASLAALRHIRENLGAVWRPTFRESREMIEGLVRESHERVCGLIAGSDAGTTIALALVKGNSALAAHAGDSRVYLVRNGIAGQVTDDHSFEGQVTSALGSRKHPPRIDVNAFALKPGDRMVACTDGVNKVLGDGDIARLVARARTPQHAASAITRLVALRHGGDNATASVYFHAAGGGKANGGK